MHYERRPLDSAPPFRKGPLSSLEAARSRQGLPPSPLPPPLLLSRANLAYGEGKDEGGEEGERGRDIGGILDDVGHTIMIA